MDIQVITLVAAPFLVLTVTGLALRIGSKNKELRQMRRLYLDELRKHEKVNTLLASCGYGDIFTTQADRVGNLLADNGNMKSELSNIDRLLSVPALSPKQSRYDKIALSISINKVAATGGKVSNKDADYV